MEHLAWDCEFPWLCAGDVNEIIWEGEKIGGAVRRKSKMRDFRHCVEECGLFDLGFVVHPFTWTNK